MLCQISVTLWCITCYSSMLLEGAIQPQLCTTKGKAGILQLVQKSKQAQHLCKVFASPNSSQYQVGNADIQMFLLLYGGKIDDRLHQLRYTSYIKMFASSSKISPSKLPPTERAAWYHSLRVYLQVHSIY